MTENPPLQESKNIRGGWGGTITAAAQVRRQIKAGRKPKTRTLPTLFEAVRRLCDEADRGRNLMQKYGLNPDDIRLALIFRSKGAIGSKPLPSSNEIGNFLTAFESLVAQSGGVDFLGILWWQTSPETRSSLNSAVPMWITEFASDNRAALEMLMYKNTLASMPPFQ